MESKPQCALGDVAGPSSASAHVSVTVSNMAGNVLLSDVSLLVEPETPVSEFVRMIRDHLTPDAGHYIALSSSQFSDLLVEHEVDPIMGLTRKNRSLIKQICAERLHDGQVLNFQAVTAESDLHVARTEELACFADAMCNAEYVTSMCNAVEYVTFNAIDPTSSQPWNPCNHGDQPVVNYTEATSWWEETRTDLDRVRAEGIESFEREISIAEYVCPCLVLSWCSSCHGLTFKCRQELLEHLEQTHCQDRICIWPGGYVSAEAAFYLLQAARGALRPPRVATAEHVAAVRNVVKGISSATDERLMDVAARLRQELAKVSPNADVLLNGVKEVKSALLALKDGGKSSESSS